MNREYIIQLTKQAGLDTWDGSTEQFAQCMERFATLVAAHEREECAKVCDERAATAPIGSDCQCEAEDCASAIRKRGKQ